ncbi:MAG: thymidine phosphorylase [bacterium]
MMNAIELIAKKRDGMKLSYPELEFFVCSFVSGLIPDYQMAAMLMAIYIKGMDYDETAWLTDVMLKSGEKLTFPLPDNLYVDKHSTGGVGDKLSLILAPLLASCGAKVPMLSGRGLGHTGGTLDKLESIPGFRTDLSIKEFKDIVNTVGCVISGQTPQIAPADRIMYNLRHSTSTVESIPLICASILSKKFAAGSKSLVFDVKCGNGAFMKTMDEAEDLAKNLIEVGKAMGKTVTAFITDMNQPLGYSAGNLLEVTESIEALLGKISPDLYYLTLAIGAEMLIMAGIKEDRNKAFSMLKERLKKRSAFAKFEEMVSKQGGDLTIFSHPNRMPKAPAIGTYKSPGDGYLQAFDTAGLGRLILDMGGGRKTKDDKIDNLVGLKFFKKIGKNVSRGEDLVEIHAQNENQLNETMDQMESLIKIGPDKVTQPLLVKKRIGIDLNQS